MPTGRSSVRRGKEGNVKEYYLNRFKWIFNYTSNNFFYIIGKTVCLLVGLPIYLAVFAVEMVLTFVNMLFCWIPILSVVVTVICKGTILIIDQLYYICILTDLRNYREATVAEPDIAEADYEIYETTDEAATDTQTLQADGSMADEQQTDETATDQNEVDATEEAQDQATERTEQK